MLLELHVYAPAERSCWTMRSLAESQERFISYTGEKGVWAEAKNTPYDSTFQSNSESDTQASLLISLFLFFSYPISTLLTIYLISAIFSPSLRDTQLGNHHCRGSCRCSTEKSSSSSHDPEFFWRWFLCYDFVHMQTATSNIIHFWVVFPWRQKCSHLCCRRKEHITGDIGTPFNLSVLMFPNS